MKTEDCGQPPDAELLGAGLFRLAGLAVEPLTVRQLLPLHKLLKAVVNVTHWLFSLLCLPHWPRVGRGNVHRDIKERVVCLAGLVAGQASDAGLEGPAEDRGDHGVGLRPQHSHLVVHAGQEVEELGVEPDKVTVTVSLTLSSHLSSM